MSLKWFWIKVPNFQVISEITKNNFSVTPVCVYSRPCAHAVTAVPHMYFCVSKFKQHWLFCYFITLLIVLLIWTTLLYIPAFHFQWVQPFMNVFKQFLSIAFTLQVLYVIFKRQKYREINKIFIFYYSFIFLNVLFLITT